MASLWPAFHLMFDFCICYEVLLWNFTLLFGICVWLYTCNIVFYPTNHIPLLKKCTLNKDQHPNYRPFSNLSLISKIIERVVESGLTDFLYSNNLLNPHQSAYCKHRSTETALLYIHDQLINVLRKSPVFVFLTFLLPLTPLSTAS